jgi:hypothetical protein
MADRPQPSRACALADDFERSSRSRSSRSSRRTLGF